MKPPIFNFKRSYEEIISLDTTAVPEGWYASGNNLYKSWGFSLSQLGTDQTDFTNLFKYYKINAANVQMYFSNTNSGPTMGDNMYYPNAQIMMHIDTNLDGSDESSAGYTSTYYESQTAKRRLCLNTNGKPVSCFMKCRQLADMYGGTANTDRATVRPRWMTTAEPTTPHYGYKMMLQRVDGQAFGSLTVNKQVVKIVTTLYFSCKKVQ